MRQSKRGRRGSWIFWITALFAFIVPGTAHAYSYTVTEESDFYFTVDSDNTLVVIYGNSNSPCSNGFADPYLWVYEDGPESNGALVAWNDDGNHNSTDQCVSSKIYTTLNAGDYRLRAGYCCTQQGLGQNPSGYDYEIVTDLTFDGVSPNTPTTTTTTTTSTTTSTTTTTTIPQTIGPPMNLTGEITSNGVFLDWDAPNTGNVDPERYAISFRIPPAAGWGVATGNVGDENALNTEYTLPFSIFESTGGLGEEYVFDVRADNDTLGVYSGWSTQVTLTVEEPTPPTTTTTSTTTTTTSTTTTTLPPTTTTEVPPSTTTTTTTTTTTSPPPPPTTSTVPPTTTTTTTSTSTTTTTTSTTTTTTTTTVPPTTTTTRPTTTTTSPPTTTVPPTPTTTVPARTTTTTEAIVAPTTTLPRATTTTTNPVRQPTIVSQNEEQIAEAAAISDKIEDDELAGEVFKVIAEEKVSVEDVKTLVSNDNFETLDDDQVAAIAQALSDEDDEVKEVFEAEVDIFDGATDEYVPSGSTVTVAERRIIVAATAITMAVPVAAAKPAPPAPAPAPSAPSGSGPAGGGSSGDGSSGRKDD